MTHDVYSTKKTNLCDTPSYQLIEAVESIIALFRVARRDRMCTMTIR